MQENIKINNDGCSVTTTATVTPVSSALSMKVKQQPSRSNNSHNKKQVTFDPDTSSQDKTTIEKEKCIDNNTDNLVEGDAVETEVFTKVWFQKEKDTEQHLEWELTWPIWHMLPREERRSLARRYGYNTIGEFEEHMILHQAEKDSTSISAVFTANDNTDTNLAKQTVSNIGIENKPYDNKYAYHPELRESSKYNDLKPTAKIKSSTNHEDSDDDDDDNVDRLSDQDDVKDEFGLEIMMANGGKILMLPDDTLHRIFAWLCVDTYATLALVSPHWKSFTRTEATYKRLCERLYLNQSMKQQLHVSRFNNSYRTMLEKRPRIRAGGGVYVMKYARIRKIQRDMFTEIPAGAVLEMVYYRYLYFEENGRVLYALTPTPPHEMFPRLKRVCLTGQPDRSAVWGTYKVRKTSVIVHAKQSWHHVQLSLSIDINNNTHGRNGCLTFDHHMTSVTGNFDDNDWTSDRIVYDTPEEPFRFIKDKRL